jgi:hypothetical protein
MMRRFSRFKSVMESPLGYECLPPPRETMPSLASQWSPLPGSGITGALYGYPVVVDQPQWSLLTVAG